jgi:hypothetical protein
MFHIIGENAVLFSSRETRLCVRFVFKVPALPCSGFVLRDFYKPFSFYRKTNRKSTDFAKLVVLSQAMFNNR